MLFVVHISSDKGKDVEDANVLNRYPVLQHFHDVFSIEIPNLLPHKELDFSIDLVPRITPASKETYMMSTLESMELKLQLK